MIRAAVRLLADMLAALYVLAGLLPLAVGTKNRRHRSSRKVKAGRRPRFLTDRPLPHADGRRISQGHYVIRWIEANCVHTNDRWIGKPFRLMAWQKAFILRLFEVDPETNLRRYRFALLGIAKKNGKTEMAAALACYFAFGSGEPAALVVCAAAADHQADLVFNAAKTMCEMSPTLAQITETWADEITCPSLPGSKIKRYAVGGGTLDGPNIYVAIIDELHEWVLPKHEKTHTVLTQGGATRREPLVLQITTAGTDVEHTIWGKQYLDGLRLATENIADEDYDYSFYFEWWQPDPDADWKDPEAWAEAHPSLGVTVSLDYLKELAKRRSENDFRRYWMNLPVDAEERWIGSDQWAELKIGPKLERKDGPHGHPQHALHESSKLDPEQPTYVWIDMSKNRDSAAVAVVQRITYRNADRIYGKVRIWENPYPATHALHEQWRMNIFEVENYLRELRQAFPEHTATIDDEDWGGPAFYYDPMYFERSAQILYDEGLAMIEVPQTDQRMIPVARDFIELINIAKLAHDGDPQLARHVGAVVEHEKPRGSRITKPRGSKKKIDGAVAFAGAAHKAYEPERDEIEDEPNIW